jgi:ppGpp synthetase/RelA/SpoT-type nucleotidyltranferase
MVKLVGKDEGNYYYRRFNDAIGSFAWQIDKRYNEAILFPLDSFDIDYYSFIPLKDGEVLFRYETDSIKGIMKPIIKINVNKALVYFNDSEASARDEVRFETRGVKADYIVLEEGYDKKFAKGGKLGFDGLAKKVAKNYEGKKVPKKYQNEYGKVYSKEEAKEVGFKVANKVKIMKGGKFAEGGEIMVKESYEVGDKIRFRDKYRNQEHDGIIDEINERGTYVVGYGSGLTTGIRGVEKEEVIGAYPKVEVKKKRFGFFGAGGELRSTSLNNLKKELALHKRQKRELTAKKIRPVTIIGKGDHKPVQARGLAFAELDRRIQETQFKINSIQNKFANGGKVDDNEPHHFTIYQYKDKVALANDDYDYIDNWYGTKQNVIDFVEDSKKKGLSIGSFVQIENDPSWTYSTSSLEKMKRGVMRDDNFAKGGLAKVEIVNEGEVFDDNKYSAILGDFDLDGLPNVDDLEPLNENNKSQIEQLKFSKTFKELLETKKDLDIDMNKFVNKLRQNAPKESKIYARTKTPFSILNKLVSSRLLNEKHGLKDLVGTTIAFDNLQDLNAFKNKVVAGKYGKVLDFDDFYEDPKDGYRAYHFIIEQAGVPIELQLKTERMKNINVLSHDAYKNKRLNSEYMNYLTNLAKDSDEGNKFASKEFDQIMKDKVKVQQMLTL